MKTKYKTKIGREIVFPLAAIFCLLIFLSRDGYSIRAVLAVGLPIIFIIYLFKNTYYTIADNLLIIKSGFLVNINIDIDTITEIRETNNILSAPAFSLDRLKITYSHSKNVMVSPADREQFIDQLIAANSSIVFVPKK